jgi:hypothetical protein
MFDVEASLSMWEGMMAKTLHIEEKLDKLTELAQAILRTVHNKLDRHEWVQDWRGDSPDNYLGHQRWIECLCGEQRMATTGEFATARPKSGGSNG